MFNSHVASLCSEPANRVRQRVGQNPPEPARHLGIAVAGELVSGLVSLLQGLLHNIRGIDLALKPDVQLHPAAE